VAESLSSTRRGFTFEALVSCGFPPIEAVKAYRTAGPGKLLLLEQQIAR
jgi:hypothetical protein